MAYKKTNWVNNTEPAISADNLNKIEEGIEENSQELEKYNQAIDVKSNGLGVAIGKSAETDNLVDSEWDIKAPNFQGVATDATNATNVNVTATNPSSETTFYPALSQNTSGNNPLNVNARFSHECKKWNNFTRRHR